MNKRLIVWAMVLLQTVMLAARPGYKVPVDVEQPDGTTVALVMQGDEFHSFMTTTDGYTVVKGDDGFYRYATVEDGDLKATPFVAKDADRRTAKERMFLEGSQKMVCAPMSEAGKRWKKQVGKMYRLNPESLQGGQHRAITPGTLSERVDYKNFKGLVVICNWNDRAFKIDDPVAFYTKLTSEKNYKDPTKTVYPYEVRGSVRDYFCANSMGIFDPTFDVVGPITIDYSCLYPWPKDENGKVREEWDANCINIMKAVMEQLKDKVDFSNYDLNNDGFIDMVYVIFAGYGSYVVSNNPKYMWPHANDFSTKENDTDTQCWSERLGFPLYNGKKFGRYACSMEILDREAEADKHAYLDGIGTMCHEFSHVLGLADHYQTDGSLPTAVTPLGYDVMDEGCDFEQGLAPVGYSAFERHVLGMADETITVLDKAGNYKLKPFHTNNTAYIVKSAKEGEVFYVENRQKEGWDRTLPGHGLLVWRIDTSDPQRFIKNEPNNFVGQECVQLLGGSPISTANLSPSTNEVWKEKGAAINLFEIMEQDGVISFDASTEATPTGIVDVRSKTEEVRDTDNATYNLAGERVTKEYKGLIIKNGKKMLKR